MPCSNHRAISDCPVVDTGVYSNSLVFTQRSGHKMHKSCSYYRGIFYCPVATTGEYLRENHQFRVWELRKSNFLYFPVDRTSWDKYMFNGNISMKFYNMSHFVRSTGEKKTCPKSTLCNEASMEHWGTSLRALKHWSIGAPHQQNRLLCLFDLHISFQPTSFKWLSYLCLLNITIFWLWAVSVLQSMCKKYRTTSCLVCLP